MAEDAQFWCEDPLESTGFLEDECRAVGALEPNGDMEEDLGGDRGRSMGDVGDDDSDGVNRLIGPATLV